MASPMDVQTCVRDIHQPQQQQKRRQSLEREKRNKKTYVINLTAYKNLYKK